MKSFANILSLLLLVSLNGCTVVKHLGPYSGKIIDADTGMPIKDAIVYVYIYTVSPSPAGSMSSFAGYEKTFSDQNGHFKINKLIFTFRPLSIWGSEYYLIAQPEYGTLTGYDKVNKLKTFQENRINLKKLRTPEDFKINFGKHYSLPSGISPKDYKYLSIIQNIHGIKGKTIAPYNGYQKEFKRISTNTNSNIIRENYSQHELRLWESFGLAMKDYEQEKKRKGIGGKSVTSISPVPKTASPPNVIHRNGKILVPKGKSLQPGNM